MDTSSDSFDPTVLIVCVAVVFVLGVLVGICIALSLRKKRRETPTEKPAKEMFEHVRIPELGEIPDELKRDDAPAKRSKKHKKATKVAKIPDEVRVSTQSSGCKCLYWYSSC